LCIGNRARQLRHIERRYIIYIMCKGLQNKMEKQLELVAKSYDKTIVEHGKKDALSYDRLPDYITNEPDYLKWKMELDGKQTGSECKEIKDYLLPETNMKFIDLGCCLNLMFKGYDQWSSTYHGVDISSKTIQLLNEFVNKNNLSIGSLYNGSIHQTPFEESYFDIGACVGVLEYYEKDFVEKAIIEAHRILKPNGKFVLDIPNIVSPSGKMMMLIEEYMGRPDLFDMLSHEFEAMLENYFEIEKKDRTDTEDMGFMYCLRCKK